MQSDALPLWRLYVGGGQIDAENQSSRRKVNLFRAHGNVQKRKI